MSVRFAFAGFRHGHIMEVYRHAGERAATEVVAAVEEHDPTRAQCEQDGVTFTHETVQALSDDTDAYDVLAIGDYFGRRGSIAVSALERGKHVILDKPICTSIRELERLKSLSVENGLSVFCQLGNRYSPQMRTLRRLIREGMVGKIITINFMGQHPLLYGKRADWYFEEGKHGGTINDIGIHAMDILPWVLGTRFAEVIAARTWNDTFREHPHFELCAQMMLRLESGAGAIGDVSYLSPDSQGYKVPQYWRYTLHGEEGILETSRTSDAIRLWKNGESEGRSLPLDPPPPGGYLDDFLGEIGGDREGLDLTTAEVLSSARVALLVQEAAADGRTHVSLME